MPVMDGKILAKSDNLVKDQSSPQPDGAPEQNKNEMPFIISVAGGMASGKTTVCNVIISRLHDQRVVLINQILSTELLLSCMETLKNGQSVNIPDYDYKTHKKSGSGCMVKPSDVIILEGIKVLHDERVRDMMNIKIFVDSDSDVRLGRRIKRDTVERGRIFSTCLTSMINM